jgi:hypothetical protein
MSEASCTVTECGGGDGGKHIKYKILVSNYMVFGFDKASILRNRRLLPFHSLGDVKIQLGCENSARISILRMWREKSQL